MADWIIEFISSTTYLGVFFLMLIENIFPPIPSELIMPFAGYLVTQGELNPYGAVLAGSLGSLLGVLPWYVLGRYWQDHGIRNFITRYGRWLTLTIKDYEKSSDWFEKHGNKAVFFGRLVPAIRTWISLPAGVFKMGFLPFLLLSWIGTTIWTIFLMLQGYWLKDSYEKVEVYLNPISTAIVILIFLIYLYRLITYPGKKQKNTEAKGTS